VFRRLAASSGKTQRILLCHNLEDHDAGTLQRFLMLGPFEVADAFLLHSEANRREIEQRYPGRPAAAATLPVPALQIDRDSARRALGVEGRLVLFLGLVRPYKGVDVLIQAAPRIVRETGARVAIVGEVFEDAGEVLRLAGKSPVSDRILV